jgi:hypothetical protein
MLQSISAPDVIESRLRRLEFHHGAPSPDTAALLYDSLDFVHGVEAFINAFPGDLASAIREGFRVGRRPGQQRLDVLGADGSQSLFLTAIATHMQTVR